MKKIFLISFLGLLSFYDLIGEVNPFHNKGWEDLENRKSFPLTDFFGKDSGSISEDFLPDPTEYAEPESLESEEGFVQYTPMHFIPDMRKFFLPGQIVKGKKAASCVFVGGPKGEELYFMKEGAVCRVKDRWLNMNIVYTVLRKAKTVRLSHKNLYYYIATVRLKRFVGKGHYATVDILNSSTEIDEGDILVPYENYNSVINVVDKKPGVAVKPSKIVSFAREKTDVSGSGDYVFIPEGNDFGFVKGRIYAIHRTNSWEKKFSSPSRYLVKDVFLVGKVLIVDVNDAGAVGYVLDSKGELYLEDVVGGKWDQGFH